MIEKEKRKNNRVFYLCFFMLAVVTFVTMLVFEYIGVDSFISDVVVPAVGFFYALVFLFMIGRVYDFVDRHETLRKFFEK